MFEAPFHAGGAGGLRAAQDEPVIAGGYPRRAARHVVHEDIYAPVFVALQVEPVLALLAADGGSQIRIRERGAIVCTRPYVLRVQVIGGRGAREG